MKENTDKQKTKKTVGSKKNKKSWLKWVLILLGVVSIFTAFQFLKFQKQSAVRREATQIQQKKLVEFWESQGLSEEEIQEKLEEDRASNLPERETSIFGSIMRTVRHSTGTGPGTGGGPGAGGGPGDRK
ncbi:MAG: hypothetical protein HN981_04230 [Candidatus Pacebacteria bacterium]|jgi:hypothetical protein|nr:hypothetical protein [Candidatus Paceibacterota bacterium]MBT4652453.1 hypothetical protein [Candidatus Paceibacterota bacterium]MBT6756280.1 hypothetical protein [Candidatus Paceibacterota bacterium]MBT6921571.1 hypothetical protein [Candidatus Paceibacterota bacterium]